jgi:hypothetical protein
MEKNLNSNAMATKGNTQETIDFEKDFAKHILLMSKEIAGLNGNLDLFRDDYRVLESLLTGVEDAE